MDNYDDFKNIGLDSMIEVIKGKVLNYSIDKFHEENKDQHDSNLVDDGCSVQNSNN